MALNARGDFTTDLSLFGSLVQDINATDLPPGGSPDNAECFFLPGGIYTRPALVGMLPEDTLDNSPTIMSVKEFPGQSGDNLTVFLDSNGLLYFNDPLNPAAATEIDQVTPGVQFKAENFFGKQWYSFYGYQQSAAFSDSPFVGVDVPRYYDGQDLWRVTSDAPGQSPQFANLFTAAVPLVAPAIHGTIGIEAVVSDGEQSGGTPPPSPTPSVLQSGVSYAAYPATTTTFTFPIAVFGGNTVLVAISGVNVNVLSVTDNQGNSYSLANSRFGFFDQNNYIYLASGVTGGPLTVTVTFSNLSTNTLCGIACHEIVGLVTAISPVDGTASHPFPAAPPYGTLTMNSGTVATANANDWIFSMAFTDLTYSSAPTAPGGFLLAATGMLGGGNQISTAYLRVSATGSYSAIWSVPSGTFNGSGLTIGLKLNPPAPPLPSQYWTKLKYTCESAVPISWLESSISVTGFVGTNASLANITGTISEISGDVFWLDVITTQFVDIVLASMFAVGTVAASAGNYMVRQGNTVTAYLGATLPANAFLEEGFWISVVNQNNTIINGPDWLITGMSRDSNGIVTVTLETQLTNLPVGASLYINPAVANFTGTASGTVGSNALTWSGGSTFDPTWVGQPITYAGNGYVVSAVQSSTSLTLTTPLVSGSGSAFTVTVAYFSAGYITVKQVLSAAGGFTQFTFQSLNTTPINITSGGFVYQTWSPQGGTYGNAAQIMAVGFDENNGWYVQFFQLGPDSALNASEDTGSPQAIVQAQAAAGLRNAVCMFESQDGAITAPSVPMQLAVSGGTSLIQAQKIPIGPPGTAKRIIAFTPAEGSSYYYVTPVTIPQVGAQGSVIATGTIIDDNITTSQVLDFSDTQLTSGTQIDADGNNLFNQVVLAPCLGVIEYQQRMAWLGEINNVKNFVNMGFDGGFIPPAGAVTVTNGSATVAWGSGSQFATGWVGSEIIINGAVYVISSVASGTSLNINAPFQGTTGIYPFTALSTATALPLGWDASEGDGAGSLTGFPSESPYFGFSYVMKGGFNNLIQQNCVTDGYGAPILLPKTPYTMRLLAQAAGSNLSGNLVIDIYSASQSGVLAFVSFPVANMSTTGKAWLAAKFSASMPAAIPSDAVIRVYLSNVPNGVTVTIDENEVIYTQRPVSFDQIRVSYYQNPFGYDSISGVMSVDPSEPITGAFRQRGYLYLLSDSSLFQSQNNGTGEPSTWPVIQYAASCGCSGPNAVDFAEDFAYWAGRYGERVFVGSPTCKKISQELAPTWESINWAAQTTIWVKNDPVNRILHCGVPLNGAAAPTADLQMSYRLSDEAYNVPDPIHVSQYSGRLICTDLGRRWSPWNLPLNCADMCARPTPSGIARVLVVGGGNGKAPGAAPGFGNLYTFDVTNYPPLNPAASAWNCTDQDYGPIGSYYVTYFFFAPDLEQQPLLSLHRKLFNYLAIHATGVGSLQVTPYIDALSKPQKPLTLTALSLTDPGFDLEWHPITRGNRVAWKLAPVGGAMAVTHLIVSGRREMVFPLRGSVFGGS